MGQLFINHNCVCTLLSYTPWLQIPSEGRNNRYYSLMMIPPDFLCPLLVTISGPCCISFTIFNKEVVELAGGLERWTCLKQMNVAGLAPVGYHLWACTQVVASQLGFPGDFVLFLYPTSNISCRSFDICAVCTKYCTAGIIFVFAYRAGCRIQGSEYRSHGKLVSSYLALMF